MAAAGPFCDWYLNRFSWYHFAKLQNAQSVSEGMHVGISHLRSQMSRSLPAAELRDLVSSLKIARTLPAAICFETTI